MSRTARKLSIPPVGPRMAEALGRRNGFGLLRLVLALAVIVTHAIPLGMGRPDLGLAESRGQTNIGAIAVSGFFVLSGILITRSGIRLSPARFLWNRAIRIFPGLWACLLLTAFVVAPAVAYHQGRLAGFWSHPEGPLAYLEANWSIGVYHWGISGLLDHVPHPTAFNGSLWSLAYEVLCYLPVVALAALGVLRRARWAVALMVLGLYCYVVHLASGFHLLRAPEYEQAGLGDWQPPLLGPISMDVFVPLALMFGLGALAELYKDRLPINDPAGVAAAAVFLGTARYGGFTLCGLPALAYLLIWLACRMPGPLTRVGTRVDLSYGVYIYAFPIQQCLSLWGFNKHGYWAYTTASLTLSVIAAFCSWHVVEKPALKLKDLGLRKPPRAPASP